MYLAIVKCVQVGWRSPSRQEEGDWWKLALEDKCKNCKKYTCLVDKDVTERYHMLILDRYEPLTFFVTSSEWMINTYAGTSWPAPAWSWRTRGLGAVTAPSLSWAPWTATLASSADSPSPVCPWLSQSLKETSTFMTVCSTLDRLIIFILLVYFCMWYYPVLWLLILFNWIAVCNFSEANFLITNVLISMKK